MSILMKHHSQILRRPLGQSQTRSRSEFIQPTYSGFLRNEFMTLTYLAMIVATVAYLQLR